jgi:hypothetical protein
VANDLEQLVQQGMQVSILDDVKRVIEQDLSASAIDV